MKREELEKLKLLEKYKLVYIYYQHYGNLDISKDFKTLDGYTVSEQDNSVGLGRWINGQKDLYKRNLLPDDKIKLLEEININWKTNYSWEEMYELATKYYEYYGHLIVSPNFKTIDGINPSIDDEAVELGKWLQIQRSKGNNNKLSKDKKELLNNIGIIWKARIKINKIEEILIENNIKIPLNEKSKKILNKLTIQEFYSKLIFLLDNNISVIDSEENLNNIFKMSSNKMEKIYNINLEQILKEYYYMDKTMIKNK